LIALGVVYKVYKNHVADEFAPAAGY